MGDANIANTTAGPIQKVVLADPVTGQGITPSGGSGGSGDASAANQTAQITAANLANARMGAVDETAPATDTATSGTNGRLQRIAQRITALITHLSKGRQAATNGLSVALSTEDKAALDALLPGTTSLQDESESNSFAALTTFTCREVLIVNNRSGAVELEWRMGGSGGTEIIPVGAFAHIKGITNANEIQLRRTTAGANVTVSTRRMV